MFSRSLVASCAVSRRVVAKCATPLCIQTSSVVTPRTAYVGTSPSSSSLLRSVSLKTHRRAYTTTTTLRTPSSSSSTSSSSSSASLFPDLTPFHLAFPVDDLDVSRHFYGEILGCPEGRSSPQWIDFDLFGHQIVAHLRPPGSKKEGLLHNHVDGHGVPVPHFGIVLTMDKFNSLADRLKKAGVKFVIEPYIRFKGQVGEQATMFFMDPSGNALEFKAFADMTRLFAK
eukprot:TRINITY_DN2652_c0_g1_i2.p1 TRINITY_DN2652_c0_g1~~TRINITY_DN2652_c0_g1_i2.p1  ORF type:complete len:240 (-),score=60.69 TRINITY_DN2652_c0_g1_i2:66-749(-)